MPTITKTIGSGGGRDYATMAAWWAAIPANLVTADEQWIGELYNDSTFTEAALTLSGKTTDATRNIILRCAAGQSFKHNAGKLTNALRYNPANGMAYQSPTGNSITITGNMHLELNGLQVMSGTGQGIVQTNSGPNVRVVDCVSQGNNGGTGVACINLFDGRAINCVAIETSGGTACISNGGAAKFHSVTAVQMGAASGFGFRGNYDAPECTNCIAVGFGTNYQGLVTGNYNASSQASPPGANSVGSITASDQFENIAGTGTMDFRLKSTASLRLLGIRDQTYTNDLDILGQARSVSTPGIGAHEYVAPPPSVLAISTTMGDFVSALALIEAPPSSITINAAMASFVSGLALAQQPGVINFGPLKNGSNFRWDRSDITAVITDRTTDAVLATITGVTSGPSGGSLTSTAIVSGGLYRVTFKIPAGGALPNGAKGEADLAGV